MIRTDPWAWILGALLLLTLPLDWLLAAVCAAGFHELCHAVSIYFLGGRVAAIHIGPGGAIMETKISGQGREILCALAGPVGSFLLLTLCHDFPKLAICAGVQGLFNLLPVYPLDGGRILQCGLSLIVPQKAETIGNRMETVVLLSLFLLTAFGSAVYSLGILPLFLSGFLILKAILRKRPCKRSQFGVQ